MSAKAGLGDGTLNCRQALEKGCLKSVSTLEGCLFLSVAKPGQSTFLVWTTIAKQEA